MALQTGFLEKEKIIYYYNTAIEEIKKVLSMEKSLGVLPKVDKELKYAATNLYDVIDWSFKRHLWLYWDGEYATGRITRNERNQNQRCLNTPVANINYLLDKMKLYAQPDLSTTGIHIDVICKLRQPVRNDPSHNASDYNLKDILKIMPEARKVVNCYVDSKIPLLEVDSEISLDSNWDELFSACNHFDPRKSNYILVIGKTDCLDSVDRELISSIPWNMVIDFDPESKKQGLYQAFCNAKGVSPHYVTRNQFDNLQFSANSAVPYWFFSIGDIDIPDTIVRDSREWQRNYLPKLSPLISDFASVYPRNTKVVIAHDAAQIIANWCAQLDVAYQDRVQFIVTTPKETFVSLLDQYNPQYISIDLPSLAKGVQRFESYFGKGSKQSNIIIPAKGGDKSLLPDQYADIQEDLELVYKGIEESSSIEASDKSEIVFYKGAKVSWFGLDHHFDVDRKVTNDLLNLIKASLYKEEKDIVIIPHEPGVGGSTVARRLAWELHEEYPTVFVREYRSNTAQKIIRLFRHTAKHVVVFIEVNEVGLDNCHKLYNAVRTETISATFVQIMRRSTASVGTGLMSKPVIYLNDKECKKIIDKLLPYIKEHYEDSKVIQRKECELLDIYASPGDIARRTPFYMGLVAFEEEFRGIESFIQKFTSEITVIQKQLLVMISLVYYYTGKSVPSKFLANFVIPEERRPLYQTIELEEYFPPLYCLDSIILTEQKGNDLIYRPRHLILAKEILVQIIGGGQTGDLWKQSIADWAVPFITVSRITEGVQSQETIQLLRDLFISRDSEEITTDRFAKLIMDMIESDAIDAVGTIFKKLVEVYPGESHFWGHLARYYAHIGDLENAIKSADKALKIVPTDPILRHIKGMCLKKEAKVIGKKLIDGKIFKDKLSAIELGQMDSLREQWQLKVESAAHEFKLTTENSRDLPGYISHIQMLVETIDAGRVLSGSPTQEEFFENNKDPWYVHCIDQANSLLETARRLDPDGNDMFLANAESQVLGLFRDYKSILRTWNSMLVHGTNKPAIRRQIVRAYQNIASGFERYDEARLSELLALLEVNILEDTTKTSSNINLWFKVARCSKQVSIDSALGKLLKWKTTTELIIADYYYYILKTIKGINGTTQAAEDSKRLLEELKLKGANLPNKIKVYEWLGPQLKGGELSQLVEKRRFEQQLDDNGKLKLLRLIDGTIAEWKHPGHGVIDVNGLKVFFRPGIGNDKTGIYESDVGKKVKFCLGFSQDGLRAFDNSVKTYEYLAHIGGDEESATTTLIRKLKIDETVECRVTGNGEYHVYVSVDGVDEKCSIYYKELNTPYSKTKRPEPGTIFTAKVINYSEQHGCNLSLKVSEVRQENSSETLLDSDLAGQMKKWLHDSKSN